MKTEILFEDQDIIVCRKLAGFPVQTRKTGAMDMESELKNHIFRETKKKPYLAVIHRLDQPVEGILVFAKNKKSAAALSSCMQKGGFGKYYIAEIDAVTDETEGTLTDYLYKDALASRAVVVTKEEAHGKDAKKAVLHFRKIRDQFFEIALETGRFHQIRAQLSHAGWPIKGDAKYNPKENETGKKSRIHLCAYRLEFPHPVTGKKMCFEKNPDWF